MKKIKDSIILITGASGGIGSELVKEIASRGARKIYATDLNINNLHTLQTQYPEIVIPVVLDVTNLNSVLECHKLCGDTDILINNAGVEFAAKFIDNKSLKTGLFEMAVNYHGVHNLCVTFWNSLCAKQSACIVNMLSVASFTLILKLSAYCASKSAAHFLTQALRKESDGTNLKVYGVYPGYVDTQMTKNINVEKTTPQQIALETCNGIESGILDIFPDKMAKELATKIDYHNLIFSEFDK